MRTRSSELTESQREMHKYSEQGDENYDDMFDASQVQATLGALDLGLETRFLFADVGTQETRTLSRYK